ncbi:MAG: hypothetical protein IJO05_07205 [Oscillospiraceae bacterium]|nr:hypothetical protein [Oscillospiraceae bacterium]
MKKLLTVFLVLVLIAGGLFLWKGGHHALFLAETIEQWLDADDADQSVTVQLQRPGFTAEDGTLNPQVEQLSLSADTFWTEYHDRPLFGLTTQGVTVYTDGKILYLDTGKSYSLPELSGLRKTAREIAFGLLLHGRVTKDGDTYRVTMDTDKLELHADLTADRTIRAATVTAVLPDETALSLSMQTKEPAPHTIPQPVLDAMVRSRMEPPMPLTEPLEHLLPALETLLPLEGSLTLGVECGILNLSETAILRMDGEKAELERRDTTVTLALPADFSRIDPAALALLLLRSGSYSRSDQAAQFDLSLPADTTNSLCSTLVPQLTELGITFAESRATVAITEGSISSILLTADGEVPFLITTIPVSFRAELTIP